MGPCAHQTAQNPQLHMVVFFRKIYLDLTCDHTWNFIRVALDTKSDKHFMKSALTSQKMAKITTLNDGRPWLFPINTCI